MVIDGRFLDTPDSRGNGQEIYSSSDSDRYNGHIRYHPYGRSDRGYFPYEFKKWKPPTFYGELRSHKMPNHGFLGWISSSYYIIT